MDVVFAIAMLGLMAAAIIALGRTWPRSSRGGGYRAGRGLGAGDAAAAQPPVPEEDGAPWRWSEGTDGDLAGDDDGDGGDAGAGEDARAGDGDVDGGDAGAADDAGAAGSGR